MVCGPRHAAPATPGRWAGSQRNDQTPPSPAASCRARLLRQSCLQRRSQRQLFWSAQQRVRPRWQLVRRGSDPRRHGLQGSGSRSEGPPGHHTALSAPTRSHLPLEALCMWYGAQGNSKPRDEAGHLQTAFYQAHEAQFPSHAWRGGPGTGPQRHVITAHSAGPGSRQTRVPRTSRVAFAGRAPGTEQNLRSRQT